MKYNYPIISGSHIQFDDLKLARAKRIALALNNHPFCNKDSIEYYTNELESEIILVTLDNEIPDNPLNGIQVYEDVAIICHKIDNNFPEIYALREDFRGGLPHTNLCHFEHPISLCVTEQNFEEVKHLFNEFEFIELIRRWFSLTAEGKLHQEDQPLEAFFRPYGYVIISNNFRPELPCFLQRIGNTRLYTINNNSNNSASFAVHYFKADAQVHGFIRKEPSTISDLNEKITVEGVPLSEVICNYLNFGLNNFTAVKDLWTLNPVFLSEVPVLRNEDDAEPSKHELLFFAAKENIIDIGTKSGCIGKLGNKWAPLLFQKFNNDVIKEVAIELYSPLDDFNPNTAAIYNNIPAHDSNYLIIGAGAIGSQVLSIFSRMGFGKWQVIDHDFLLPHNLAKHALKRKDIGFNKAIKIAEDINELLGAEVIQPIEKNFLDFVNDKNFKDSVYNIEAILDMSTSIGVARKLARDIDGVTSKRRISAFLNPIGTDLVILAEDKKRINRLDLLEMQYYRSLYSEKELNTHLKIEQHERVNYNRNSCRDITNKINQTNVGIHSAICAKALQQILVNERACLSIWHINETTNEVKKHDFEPTTWERIKVLSWEVCIDIWLINKMQDYRKSKLPNETGGILIGSVDNERKIIYLFDTIFAPEDSIEEKDGFIRGTDGLIVKYQKYLNVTEDQIMYLGEWHSHPENYSTNPSKLDSKLFQFLAINLGSQGYPAIMCIVGDDNYNVQISLNYERIN